MNKTDSRKRQRGSVFVETALVSTIFAFLMIGALDFGQFLFIHQALVERARSAVRWGLVNDPSSLTAIQNMVLYNQSTAPTGAAGYFGLTPSMVQVSNADSGTDDYRVVILITNYTYTILSPYIGGSYMGPNITVSAAVGQ